MARADSLVKLAWAYGIHQARRRLKRARPQLSELVETYAPDGIRAISAAERTEHPRLVTCINCGLCAFAVARFGRTRPPDLASSYMRLYSRLGEVSSDLPAGDVDLAAAAAVCPVGLPLEDVAAVVRRISTR